MCLELDNLIKQEVTTETATPVVSAPMLRAQAGVDNKLKAKVQQKKRTYLSEAVGTMFFFCRIGDELILSLSNLVLLKGSNL